jgi:NDP-sugar pyrophosphorylase family protein
MITIVVPMAGAGTRFAAEGVETPKYLLEARGATILQWAISSLPLHLASRIVFVTLAEHERRFRISKTLAELVPHRLESTVLDLDRVTRGQAETVMLAQDRVSFDDQLIIFNIDTWFRSSTFDLRLTGHLSSGDGVMGAGRMPGDAWSFAEVDRSGNVMRTAEKERISDNALTGLYHFARAGDFFAAAQDAIRSGRTTRGEYYVAPLYNDLIADGRRFVLDHAALFVPLGTPAELRAFVDRTTPGPEVGFCSAEE